MGANTLTHHGIPGMKWGKRNGPPYPLTGSNMSSTEKKWAKGKGKASSDGDPGSGEREKEYDPRKSLKRTRAKVVKQMSDDELNERIKRLEKETRYLQLEKNLDDLNPLAGKNAAMRVLSTVGTKVVLPTVTAALGAVLVNKVLSKSSKIDPETLEFIKKAMEKGVLGKK